jgi:hypothetical protein
MCLELMRKKRRQGMLRFRAVRMQIVKVCVRVCLCRYRASRKYILVPEVNVVASPPLLLLSPLLLIHPYPGLLKASTLRVGVSTCLLVGTPSFFLLSKKFWHS